MGKRWDDDGDRLAEAVRRLPPLEPAPAEDRRMAARAQGRYLQRSRRARRWARPLLPLSIAGLTVSYLVWAFHQAAQLLGP
jgi:hypothetical protein